MAQTIPISQASPLYTTALKAKHDDFQKFKVNNFFRSFFPEEICKERYPVIEVRRGQELVAIDVRPGHQGIRTQITKHTQKAFDPFNYKLFFDATTHDAYYRAFGSDSFNVNAGAELVNGIAAHNNANQQMIERAIELHCASILQSGTCTSFNDGSIIDFKRQGDSMVVKGVGETWSTDGVDPHTDLRTACDWITQEGNAGGEVFNVIMGINAWTAYRANTKVVARWNQVNNKRDMLAPSQAQANGSTFQGTIDVDTYKVNIFTYNSTYIHPTTSARTPYMDPNYVYVLPTNPDFVLFYAATPQVVMPGTNTTSLVAAKFVLSDYMNAEEKYHKFYIESAPLPVPKVPDQMYTIKPVNVA